MLRLPAFKYFAPRSLAEAARILEESGPEARVLAGGTDIFPKMKRRQARPKFLVDLRQVKGFSGIRRRNGKTVIGAGTRLHELAGNPALKDWEALRQAAALVATPSIRNAATLGGNLCQDTRCCYHDRSEGWRTALGFCLKSGGTNGNPICHAAPGSDRCRAVSAGDIAPALMALGAAVKLASSRGERLCPVEDIYREDGKSNLGLRPGEILSEVILDHKPVRRSVYLKLRRRECFDFPALGVAVSVSMDGGSTVGSARIAIGGVASAPVLAAEAARGLEGNSLSSTAVAAAAAASARAVKPVANADYAPAYLRQTAEVLVSRALSDLAKDK